jgi:DNA modification methylase
MKVEIGNATLYLGDCLEVLRGMPDNSVDSVCCDPPYGLSFMGKKWDYDVPSVEVWAECLRVLKPGGHLLAFAGTRTQHRMAVRIEDAGFEIRDMIAWVYGSGFPKSLDVSKAIDKQAGAERTEVIGTRHRNAKPFDDASGWNANSTTGDHNYTAPATEAAQQWQGWGTALKPALEPITVARKPLIGTVAENVLEHGTGAINVGGCRVAGVVPQVIQGGQRSSGGIMNANGGKRGTLSQPHDAGRWPANLIHDGSDEVTGLFPEANSARANGNPNNPKRGTNHTATSYGQGDGKTTNDYRDKGSAARFFYCAKASRADRNEGLQDPGPQFKHGVTLRQVENTDRRGNVHPTVKPTDLMRYLCRLVTPPGGVVLDCFMGSGSTGKAAMLEGFRFIGIEREAEYLEIAKARIACKAPQEPESAPMQPKPADCVGQFDLFSEAA